MPPQLAFGTIKIHERLIWIWYEFKLIINWYQKRVEEVQERVLDTALRRLKMKTSLLIVFMLCNVSREIFHEARKTVPASKISCML